MITKQFIAVVLFTVAAILCLVAAFVPPRVMLLCIAAALALGALAAEAS